MSSPTDLVPPAVRPLAEAGSDLFELLRRVEARLEALAALPVDAVAAASARLAAQTRGYYRTIEFAALIGRSTQYVSDRCRDGRIAVLPGGKPWRIPLSEEAKWNQI